MAKETTNLNNEVTIFLDEQKHPLRNEIELLRDCILSSNKDLIENIKWNGPNYLFNNQDRITIKIQPPKNIQIIFHSWSQETRATKRKNFKRQFETFDLERKR